MEIRLRSVLSIAEVLGGKEHILHIDNGVNVEGFISLLLKKHGKRLQKLILQSLEPMELAPNVNIYVNGRSIIFIDGLQTVLHEDNDVLIMPQVSGG